MNFNPKVTIKDIIHPEKVHELINEKIEKLNQICDKITYCDVYLNQNQKHQSTGKLYNIKIDLHIPKHKIASNHAESTDPFVVVRDGFATVKRQLTDIMDKQKTY
jgi:ribosome-associated translation inhibitor RaiA